MKKNTLLLVGIGAAALFFLMRRGGAQGRRRGLLDVQSPEIISQEEFEMPTIEENQRPSIVDTVQNIAQRGGEIFQNVREEQDFPRWPNIRLHVIYYLQKIYKICS